MELSLFEKLRSVPAYDAAVQTGLVLRQRGSRWWACCPASGENTPSLVVYPDDGGFHCFSCGVGGDSVALYEHVFHLKPLEAAKRLAADFGVQEDQVISVPDASGSARSELKKVVEAFYNHRWGELCEARLKSQRVLEQLHKEGRADWDDPVFVAALRTFSIADETLDALWPYGLREKLDLYLEAMENEKDGHGC